MASGLLPAGCTECSADVDCPERRCLDGVCVEASPPDAPTADCAEDTACADGERCVDGACVVFPACQQLTATFGAVSRGEVPPLPVTGVRATAVGCAVELEVLLRTGPLVLRAAGIADDGAFVEPEGFVQGRWDAVRRTGVLSVDDDTEILFGTTDFACVAPADCVGQLVEDCRVDCNGACGGPCVDGLCAAAGRGLCQ